MGANVSKDIDKVENNNNLEIKTKFKCGKYWCCRGNCDNDILISSCCDITIENNNTINNKPPSPKTQI